jgi:putative acetyltransferase
VTVAIRAERAGDRREVSDLITRAFASAPHASGTEAQIVERLRADGALAAAYVALDGVRVVGYAAFSAVRIDGTDRGWFGLGPVGVLPERQGKGTGGALIERGLAHLRADGAGGCVVLGDPAYYRRFGFEHDPALAYPGAPPIYFQRLVFAGEPPSGVVSYAPAFDV